MTEERDARRLITYGQIAAMAGVKKRTPYAWAKRGILPKPVHVEGNRPVFDEQHIVDWLYQTGRHPDQQVATE